MNWEDIDRKPSDRKVRQFAWTCCVLLALFGAYQLTADHHAIAAWSFVVAAIALASSFVPGIMRPIFVAITIATFPIGWAVSWVVLAIIFYLVVTPLAILFRLRGRDALSLRRDATDGSLWRDRAEPADDRQYFRQF